jgi:beta-galactosidase
VTEPVFINGTGDAQREGCARHWRDLIDAADERSFGVRARFADGHPAYVQHGSVHYFASLFDDGLTASLFARIATEAGLTPTPLGDSVRVSRRGKLTYVFNYANSKHVIEGVDAARFVIGTHEVGPQGVAAYRTE